MDKRKNYYIVLDSETAPIDNTIQGVNPKNMLCYDIGFAVIDKKGNIYEKYSFIVKEIFFDNNLMKSAYYYNKIPQYLQDIIDCKRVVETFQNIEITLKTIFSKYSCKAIMAHNARFDYYALQTTARYIYNNPNYYMFPFNFPFWDTLKMSRDVLKVRKSYINFCKENGFMTRHKTPRPQLKAETLYRFITQDIDFIENHTGLEDVLIEKEIFAYCIKQHKKMRRNLFE